MGVKDHPAVRASRGGNPYLPHALRDNVIPFPQRDAPAAQTRGGVPVGTGVQILDWVGKDPDRARRALEQEKTEVKPRVTLVSNLNAVIKRSEPKPQLALESPGEIVVEEAVALPDAVIPAGAPLQLKTSGPPALEG